MHSLPLALCIIVAWFALAFALAWIIGRAIHLGDAAESTGTDDPWLAGMARASLDFRDDAPRDDADLDGLSTSHGDIL